MSRDKTALLLAAAIAAAALFLAAGTARPRRPDPDADFGVPAWSAGRPVTHERFAHPDQIGLTLDVRHALHRRWRPGSARNQLCEQGWAWISDPPSEKDL